MRFSILNVASFLIMALPGPSLAYSPDISFTSSCKNCTVSASGLGITCSSCEGANGVWGGNTTILMDQCVGVSSTNHTLIQEIK